ncbi:hypothetical protein B0A50_00716 [Salinomyces thailandicus]|uniref:Calcineurin-like phosphoesterase domain-containing protein n=1 Tax=Salinomyces thailandicus TaxID=706561 RepID=A0A4U0UCG8_9PEZI|nr:hypothetical protein B0A50_00716 [Salinomyces thailandica]
MPSSIPTRFLMVSDTHGEALNNQCTTEADVVIHCGDLTDESKLSEFEAAITLLKSFQAPLKLVIAGNHDFTLDTPTFVNILSAINPPLEDDLIQREYGSFGQARALFERQDARESGIRFLDEGTHHINLANGATLTIYASPYTCSKSTGWGFQYKPSEDHEWRIEPGTDVVATHAPPEGVLDRAGDGKRAGSGSLFAAVARAKPALHCFGHIHESWGARKVKWRDDVSEAPSHFTSIDNDESALIESLATIRAKRFDTEELVARKKAKLERYEKEGVCTATAQRIDKGSQTLFVNAAIEGPEDHLQQLPWLTEIELPRSSAVSRAPGSAAKRSAPDSDEDDEIHAAKRSCVSTV